MIEHACQRCQCLGCQSPLEANATSRVTQPQRGPPWPIQQTDQMQQPGRHPTGKAKPTENNSRSKKSNSDPNPRPLRNQYRSLDTARQNASGNRRHQEGANWPIAETVLSIDVLTCWCVLSSSRSAGGRTPLVRLHEMRCEPGIGFRSSDDSVCCSRPDQEEPQEPADQVQGPLPEVPLHPGPQGFGQGREAEAELAAQ